MYSNLQKDSHYLLINHEFIKKFQIKNYNN